MRARISLLIGLSLAGCASTRAISPASFSDRLPALELKTLDGTSQDLAATIRGRVAVVSLWATWCESCAAEFGALQRLDEGVRQRGGVLVAVAEGEPHAHVAEFVKWRGLSYAQLVDEEFRLADALGQRRVPATLVVDRQGKVVFSGGAIDESAMAAIRDALNQPVSAIP